MRLPTLRQTIEAHPAVEFLIYEPENGWWAYLRDGWIDSEAQTHALHEDTLKAVYIRLRYVRRKTPADPS